MNEHSEQLVHALTPLLRAVRRDVTWSRTAAGKTYLAKNEKLTRERLEAHLNGGPPRGVAPMLPGSSTTRVAVLDLDDHDGQLTWAAVAHTAWRLCRALRAADLEPVCWRSTGGAGVHIHLLWDDPQDAYSVRAQLRDVLRACGLSDGAGGLAAGEVEVFPKQSEVAEGAYGNMFVLPLAGASVPLLEDHGGESLLPLDRDAAAMVSWSSSEPVPVRTPPPRAVDQAVDRDRLPLGLLASAVAALPNSGGQQYSYDQWLRLVFGLHWETGGSQEGFDLALQLSERADVHDGGEELELQWRHAKHDRPGRLCTGYTVLREASRHGWTVPDEWAFDVEGDAFLDPAADFDVLEVDEVFEEAAGGASGGGGGQEGSAQHDQPISRALSVEQEWLDRIAAADTDRALRVDVAEGIRADTRLRDPLSREMLAQAWARRLGDLLGVKVGIGKAREALAPVRRLGSIEAPAWLKGWLYVQQEDVFFHVGSKTRLSTKAFNLTYAAEMHALAERDDGLLGQTATHFATALVDVDKVARAMYMPRMGERFAINGETCVNLYDPSKLPATPSSEDLAASCDEGCRGRQAVAAVRRHLDWLLSDDRERRLLLDWMAWQVQRPGELVRWAPLICGEEGDGKTALAELLQGVMGGENVRVLDTTQLSSAFTGWAHGQALIVCEEVYVPGHNRYEVVNRLKPYITNAVIEVHAKRHDPFNAPNTANYLLLTNHDDALPMEEGSRRYFALRTRFADPGELKAALAAEPGYFDTLFTAIREQRGALRRWLLDHEFSEEFAAARTAPATQQRQRMVALSRSDEELGIEDMLSAGVPYVTEAVLSTKHLADALRREGVQVRTRSLSKALSKARWVSLADVVGGDNRVRVDGHQLRVWVKKGELPVDQDVREWAADVLAASGLGQQFDDNMSENEQQQGGGL